MTTLHLYPCLSAIMAVVTVADGVETEKLGSKQTVFELLRYSDRFGRVKILAAHCCSDHQHTGAVNGKSGKWWVRQR